MAPRPARLTVSVSAPRGVRAPGLGAWLAGIAPARARGEVAVALVSDARMKALNHRYRGRAEATDVLSFPASAGGPSAGRVGGALPASRPGGPAAAFLGDIVIAVGVARRQAALAGHAFGQEARVLALHGLLHLLGYDHEADDGAMARLEARLRRRGGLRDGLIARARRHRR